MMRKIDAHMHITQWHTPEGNTCFDAIDKYCEKNNIDSVDIMCCSNNADLWGGYEADQCIIAAIAKNENPNTYIHGCMLLPNMISGKAPDTFDFKYQLEMLMSMGFDGIKCCEFKPDSFKINEMRKNLPDYEPYFKYCEENDVPMCWHIADPEKFWDAELVPEFAKEEGWLYDDDTFPSYKELYTIAYEILDRHPKLRVMLAHAFFLSKYPDKMIHVLNKYPNVTIDLSPGWEMFEGFGKHYDKWFDIFRTYSDRFLFATDADLSYGEAQATDMVENITRFLCTKDEFTTIRNYKTKGIALEKNKLENILSENGRRILGNKPKTLDRAVLKEYCKTYMQYIPESKNKSEIEKYLKKNIY